MEDKEEKNRININNKDLFPNGDKIDNFFFKSNLPDINKYQKYYINDFCIPNITFSSFTQT